MKIFAVVMVWLGLMVAALFDAPDAPITNTVVASVRASTDETAPIPRG